MRFQSEPQKFVIPIFEKSLVICTPTFSPFILWSPNYLKLGEPTPQGHPYPSIKPGLFTWEYSRSILQSNNLIQQSYESAYVKHKLDLQKTPKCYTIIM